MHAFNINKQPVSQPIKASSKCPVVLTISGSDSAGCAGIAMDIKTQHALGVHTAMVVSANTAQTNQSVDSINTVDVSVFQAQLLSALTQNISAVKIGLLNSIAQIDCIIDCYTKGFLKNIPIIIDPIIQSSSGTLFFDPETLLYYKEKLLPLCTLLTPNLHELQTLTNTPLTAIKTPSKQSKAIFFTEIEAATKKLIHYGVKSVLVKGGHSAEYLEHHEWIQDYFTNGIESFWLAGKPIQTQANRGTGCALSSSIAASLALGYSHYDAIVIGKMAIHQGLRAAYYIESKDKNTKSNNQGPIDIRSFPELQCDLPYLSLTPLTNEPFSFPTCGDLPLGLYPVVDRAQWITRLAQAGVTTIQIRIKDLEGKALKQEIQQSVNLAKSLNIRLFINDYWQLAIECGAYGVHLGQEDIDSVDFKILQNAGLRLGISTHCHYEVARAYRYQPSYIACGPIFHTNTKDMPWYPQGLQGLQYWRHILDCPLVAIGGINNERFDIVAQTGVDGIAMITAITLAEDPVATTKAFSERLHFFQKEQL